LQQLVQPETLLQLLLNLCLLLHWPCPLHCLLPRLGTGQGNPTALLLLLLLSPSPPYNTPPKPTHRTVSPALAVPIALLAARARYRTGQPCLLAAAAAVGRANAHVWQLSGRVDVDAGGPYGIGWQRLLIWHVGDGDIPATARRRAGPRQVGVSLALIRVRGIGGVLRA
jgi:hypothetical protein